MKFFRLFVLLFLFCFSLSSSISPVFAASPPHIVLNFASINDLNWAAPDTEWQKEIKPKVVTSIRQMRDTVLNTPSLQNQQLNCLSTSSSHQPLTTSPSSPCPPLLAWSTLMEYMNFPMDTPSISSPYVIKMRRILEIAQEEDFPVFVPLNGFQWWDNLPELYNWWDPDGIQTDPKFFARQKNPDDFKRRFIAGYNPENKWNVEWQDWNTPMKLNIRNWGGGGFRIAPPPNLLDNPRVPLSYRDVQQARFNAIVSEIAKKKTEWKQNGKDYLFVGLSIGTEVSLNASVTPADEFEPYGYRGIQDLPCDENLPGCGEIKQCAIATKEKNCIQNARSQVVALYLEDNARDAVKLGIPKQLVYTHVWSEALQGEPRYTNYAAGSFNLYSRPGMSFYGYAKDPLSHPDWGKEIKKQGNPTWGAIEYSAGFESKDWISGLRNSFTHASSSASLAVIYNWDGLPPAAIPAIQTVLRTTPVINTCQLDDPIPTSSWYTFAPDQLSWTQEGSIEHQTVHLRKGLSVTGFSGSSLAIPLSKELRSTSIPPTQSPGTYTWFVETTGCNGTKRAYSEPRLITIPVTLPPDTTPVWVRWITTLWP